MKNISIIIPTYNEEKNIGFLIDRIDTALLAQKITYEIIVVDDNSKDKTEEIVKAYARSYPVTLYTKKGKQGKAQSLIQGFENAQYEVLAMIDADLQYPPEVLPEMLEKIGEGAQSADVVVANRKGLNTSKLRQFVSSGFRKVFANLLFGFSHDVQAGLKVFKREVFETIKFEPKSGWAFDLEFLHRAREAGYKIVDQDITFFKRTWGHSSVSFFKTSFELGLNALSLWTKKISPQHINSTEEDSMINAGVGYKKQRYITHTNLHYSSSALQVFSGWQKRFFGLVLLAIGVSLVINPLLSLQIFIAFLSLVYFIDVIFNLFLILKSLRTSQEITFSEKELAEIDERALPIYTILCPLYKEAYLLPQFFHAIDELDYPKNRLDVIVLLEEDDKETIKKAQEMMLPAFVRLVIVPHSVPKTKPKACNYGLSFAKGEYVVIYDAEDIPDKLQLKKAYLGFQKSTKNIACLQAKLNYYNPHQNLLTKFFTAEYSLWFDLTLTGLQGLNTSIPLGGTSNHFRTDLLQKLQGWDPFNVTEDADLGIRLFKKGYKTAIIDSVTLEEANSRVGNWFRQRSRWIKGYMQTYLVHTRRIFGFADTNPIHSLYFHLTIGGKIAFVLINPILWVTTIAYFILTPIVGPVIKVLYPAPVLYTAVFSLVFGNFLFLYYYMVGVAKREQWSLMKYVLLIPIYWLMMSYAAFIALFQLILKPHFWEKTVHGFHLDPNTLKSVLPQVIIETEESGGGVSFPSAFRKKLAKLIASRQTYIAGISLVVASNIGNFLNFFFNAYLGRAVSFEDFSIISLFGGLSAFASTLFGSFGTTVSYKSSYLIGKDGDSQGVSLWRLVRRRSFVPAFLISIVWLSLSPLLIHYFHTDNILLFILFTPIIFYGFAAASDRGLLSSRLMFGWVALVTVLDPIIRVVMAFVFVSFHLPQLAYISIFSAFITTFIVGWFILLIKNKKVKQEVLEKDERKFPLQFFSFSLINSLSLVMFISFDVVMARHFLSSREAGEYALVSLVGKMVYFLGTLVSPFIIPLVSRNEGAKKDSTKTLYWTLFATFALSFLAFVVFGLFGQITIPLLYGQKSFVIIQFLPIFTFAMVCFTLSRVFVSYYLAKKVYSFPVVAFLVAVFAFGLISFIHESVVLFVLSISVSWLLALFLMVVLHLYIETVVVLERNIGDFIGLFTAKIDSANKLDGKLRILVFNWRDTRHIWAGGAEVYIHELAKRWAAAGNKVTVFCGNDERSPRSQTVDGVKIIRRGGTYTVYLWAFLYYILRFRGKFDIIVDSENGIPFFTPLFIRKPVFLLIHHVHQEVFRKHLILPLAIIAQFLESKLMPFVYRNVKVIAVSESSKQEIINLGLGKTKEIKIINPGITCSEFSKHKKTEYPSFLYLGRLQDYKNIDIAIYSFAKVVKKIPLARMTVAGFGESLEKLQKLADKLQVADKVIFSGRVSDEEKKKLLAESWIAIQPSMMEGFGITVIEANASGTPVIASDVNGLRDSVVHGKTGILFTPSDIQELAEIMFTLIANKKLRDELSENAFEWSRNFSWDRSAKELLAELFHDGINNRMQRENKMSIRRELAV